MFNKRTLTALLAGVLLCAGAWGQPVVVANLQVMALGQDHYLLQVQSSGPQAFDVLRTAPGVPFTVRLYRAGFGNLPPLGPTPFGAVDLVDEPRQGSVLLHISLLPGYRIHVAQGTSPNTVDLRIQR